jgi:hypothetical protein
LARSGLGGGGAETPRDRRCAQRGRDRVGVAWASARVSMNLQAPLWISARWNSPAAAGAASSVQVLRPPADSPNTITLAGSPPNAAMLAWTQRSASS